MPLLELDNVVAAYGKISALRGLSLRVEEGETVALLGANGAGKSTTLRVISNLIRRQSGSVRFDGRALDGVSTEAIARLGISHVPEGRRVFPGLTAMENIVLGASNRGKVKQAELAADLDRVFAIFPDIKPLANALGWTLSGGQQQMVAIARGLMARPRLLLLDEPSLGLAPLMVQQVYKTVADIHRSGTTVLVVEQNAHVALGVADRGYVLETGRLVASGTPAELWANKEIEAAYLGTQSIPDTPPGLPA